MAYPHCPSPPASPSDFSTFRPASESEVLNYHQHLRVVETEDHYMRVSLGYRLNSTNEWLDNVRDETGMPLNVV